MHSSKHFRVSFFSVVLLCSLASTSLWGDSQNDSFKLHTTEPMMVENTLLAPGTYLWKRMDSLANHNVVQISDENTHRVTATILAITSYRTLATSQNELDFWETPKGSPAAVRAWFCPGEHYGREFPYTPRLALYRPLLPPPFLLEQPSPAAAPLPQKIESAANAKPANSKRKAPQAAESEGSWAVIGDGAPDASERTIPVKPKQPGTIWDALSKLPLTATLAPLIGLAGIAFLVLFLLSHLKRKKQQRLHDSAA